MQSESVLSNGLKAIIGEESNKYMEEKPYVSNEQENPANIQKEPVNQPEDTLTVKERTRNSFIYGLAVGILVTGLVLSLAYFGGRNAGAEGKEDSTPSNAAAQEPLSDKIGTKVDILLEEIDNSFLFEYDAEAVEDAVYASLFEALDDPYSAYYTEEEYNSVIEQMSGAFFGIGVVMQLNEEENCAEVVSLVESGAAKEVGIRPGDLLWEADGESLRDLSLTEVGALVKGEEGTMVHVKVYRPSEEIYLEFDVERRRIENDTVYGEMLEDGIGYLQITEFDNITDEQFEKVLTELKEQGMTSLIIDLRSNPGGTVDSVVKISDMLLGEGLITYTETKNGKRTEYKSDSNQLYDGPLVVLINGNSASASEILAGAIQDHDRGTLVGTTSFGKGIVQVVKPMTDGTAIKLTIARYYTPDGTCIHEIGVEPDVEVEISEEAIADGLVEVEEDDQLQRAIEMLTH